MNQDMISTSSGARTIGLLLFEGVTQLDLTGPYEVFSRMPNTVVRVIASDLAPVRTEWGLMITPDTTFQGCPHLDVLCVPGGWGVDTCLEDEQVLHFVRERATEAKIVSSVCTGALLLGAAGLLQGFRATTHWMSLELLRLLGAEPVSERIVRDRNRITAAGVSAGIDFALAVATDLHGADVAQAIQLAIEYCPDPPHHSGSPSTAPEEIVTRVSRASAERFASRRAVVERVARKRSSQLPPNS